MDKTHEVHGSEYPNFLDVDWEAFAKNIYRENGQGRPELNYDPAIAVLIEQQQDDAVPPDLWPAFGAMQSTPLLVFRGQLSDILTIKCVEEMQQKKPDMQFVEVVNCGHAPLLTESECILAIDKFLLSL